MLKPIFKKKLKIVLLLILITQFSCSSLRKYQLNSNRQLWRESGVKNYRMKVDLQKTGHANPMGKFIITVKNGAAESIKLANKPDSDVRNEKFEKYETVEKIFAYIENSENVDWEWDVRTIEYDSKLGYPKKLHLDDYSSFDEEIFFEVLDFEILQ